MNAKEALIVAGMKAALEDQLENERRAHRIREDTLIAQAEESEAKFVHEYDVCEKYFSDIRNAAGLSFTLAPEVIASRVGTTINDLKDELAEMTERAEKAEANFKWMVEHAADQKLDSYRELGAKAAFEAEARPNDALRKAFERNRR